MTGPGRPRRGKSPAGDPFAERVERTGPRIRALREAQGMSLSDAQRMTSRAGHAIDPTFLSRWERGERIPTLANVLVMAHVLHVSIQELLTDPPEEES